MEDIAEQLQPKTVWFTSSSRADSESNRFLTLTGSFGSRLRSLRSDTHGPGCDYCVVTCLKNHTEETLQMWKQPQNTWQIARSSINIIFRRILTIIQDLKRVELPEFSGSGYSLKWIRIHNLTEVPVKRTDAENDGRRLLKHGKTSLSDAQVSSANWMLHYRRVECINYCITKFFSAFPQKRNLSTK